MPLSAALVRSYTALVQAAVGRNLGRFLLGSVPSLNRADGQASPSRRPGPAQAATALAGPAVATSAGPVLGLSRHRIPHSSFHVLAPAPGIPCERFVQPVGHFTLLSILAALTANLVHLLQSLADQQGRLPTSGS